MGWVQRTRNLGGVLFIWLRDRTGIIQVVFDGSTCPPDCFAVGEALRGEYVAAIRGRVALRAEGAVNAKMETGAVEVFAQEAKLLNAAETPPIYIEDSAQESEAVRLKYRYLDLRRPTMQNTLRLRHRLVAAIRGYMDGAGFTEVETPILTKSTPEGARDFLVPSRIHPGAFYALPQSPQIYKQLLMLAGMDRYYQIARCFRDEDSRADRQPEFTQVDLEMSFVEPEEIQGVVEGAFTAAFEKALGIPIALPLPRMTWRAAMDRFGSDKPDTRFGLELTDVSETVRGAGLEMFETCLAANGTVRGLNVKGSALPRKEIDELTELARTYHAKGLAWLIVEAGGVKGSIAKKLRPEALEALVAAMDGTQGDTLLFVADQPNTARTALGQIRLALGRKLGLMPAGQYNLLWVTEFPLLEWDPEAGRYQAMHHPFTSPMDEDFDLMETDPGAVRAKAYDLVLNGIEMGSGSIRIHASDLQERMFSLLGMDRETAWQKFGFLLEAFQYGTPPHGGFAFGVDRLVMILAGKESLRDVIAFPKVQNGSCLMMETPSAVAGQQLETLGLAAAPAKGE
jgi:aspartyl-tRNA synthetase